MADAGRRGCGPGDAQARGTDLGPRLHGVPRRDHGSSALQVDARPTACCSATSSRSTRPSACRHRRRPPGDPQPRQLFDHRRSTSVPTGTLVVGRGRPRGRLPHPLTGRSRQHRPTSLSRSSCHHFRSRARPVTLDDDEPGPSLSRVVGARVSSLRRRRWVQRPTTVGAPTRSLRSITTTTTTTTAPSRPRWHRRRRHRPCDDRSRPPPPRRHRRRPRPPMPATTSTTRRSRRRRVLVHDADERTRSMRCSAPNPEAGDRLRDARQPRRSRPPTSGMGGSVLRVRGCARHRGARVRFVTWGDGLTVCCLRRRARAVLSDRRHFFTYTARPAVSAPPCQPAGASTTSGAHRSWAATVGELTVHANPATCSTRRRRSARSVTFGD